MKFSSSRAQPEITERSSTSTVKMTYNEDATQSGVNEAILKNNEPPGNWLHRTVRSKWYFVYGTVVLTCNLKLFKEFFARNKRYHPSTEEKSGSGEVAVISGGPRGISYALARRLLQLNFTVIMGARDVASSQKRVDQLRGEGVVNGTLHLIPLNLKSLQSTKEFTEKVIKLIPRIDYLFNNAGIMMTPYEMTEDGYEAQFQVNYLSHFLITQKLIPTIKKTAQLRGDTMNSCRIINTSSYYADAGSVDFDDLENPKLYCPNKSYYDSKLSQVIFTKQLEKKLQEEKINVHSFAVHPGAIPTDLWESAGTFISTIGAITRHFVPTIENGADALLHAALSSDLNDKGGSYMEGLKVSKSNSQANDAQKQETLWKKSENWIKSFL